MFHNIVKYKDGKDYYCKTCRKNANGKALDTKTEACSVDDCSLPLYAKEKCRKHYERVRLYNRIDKVNLPYSEDKEYEGVSNGRAYKISARALREYHLMSKYKMTIEEYELRAKDGCEICSTINQETLHVDHDHGCCVGTTGCGECTRGLLCTKCNTCVAHEEKIGLRDNHPLKDKVISYIERYASL